VGLCEDADNTVSQRTPEPGWRSAMRHCPARPQAAGNLPADGIITPTDIGRSRHRVGHHGLYLRRIVRKLNDHGCTNHN